MQCRWSGSGERAKTKTEGTLATDPEIFDVWAEFVVAIERIQAYRPTAPGKATLELLHENERGRQLILRGAALITISPGPRAHAKSTHE